MCADGSTELSIGVAPKAVPRISLHARAGWLRPAMAPRSRPNRRRARIQMPAPPRPQALTSLKEPRERWFRRAIEFITVKWAERLAPLAMARAARVLPWAPI